MSRRARADLTGIWAGPMAGRAYLIAVSKRSTRGIVGSNLSNRCPTPDAPSATEQAVLERLPARSREAGRSVITEIGTRSTSIRSLEVAAWLGVARHRMARHQPEGKSCAGPYSP